MNMVVPVIQTRILALLALLSFACTISTVVQAQDAENNTQNNTQVWHYTLRPADTLQEISKNLLNRQHSWTDLVRYNHIKNLASLQPGSIIKVPIHWLKQQPKSATVLSVSGSALVKRVTDSHFQSLKPDMAIQIGDEVSTRNGSVLIKFADGSIIRLEENSNLVFNKLSHFGHTGMVDTRMRLKKGALSTEITPLVKGSRYEISTPSAVAAVRGTKFRMISAGKSTRIEVTEGSVELRHSHGSIIVPAGEGARVQQGSAIIERSKLSPAPKPAFANTPVSDLPATFTWKDQTPAKEYRYQLIDRSHGDQRIRKATLKKPEVTLDHVNNGDYRLAIRSVNSDGFEGIDATSNITVNIASLTPELIAPLDGSILDNQMPKFIWTFDDKKEYGKLEISTNSGFDQLVTTYKFQLASDISLESELAPGNYFWRVVALADDGKESVSPTRTLSIKGLMPPIKILSVNYIGDQVGLFWKKSKHSNGYVLQVSDSTDFLTILKEETLNKSNAHLKLTPGKRYYARVKGIGNSLYKANYGPTKELFVKAQ